MLSKLTLHWKPKQKSFLFVETNSNQKHYKAICLIKKMLCFFSYSELFKYQTIGSDELFRQEKMTKRQFKHNIICMSDYL